MTTMSVLRLSYRYFSAGLAARLWQRWRRCVIGPYCEVSDGMFNVAGYELMGLVAASFIFTAIAVSALGTHSLIPNLGRRR